MNDDEKFDMWLRETAQAYNRPPAVVPREEMWRVIAPAAAHAASPRCRRDGALRPGSTPRPPCSCWRRAFRIGRTWARTAPSTPHLPLRHENAGRRRNASYADRHGPAPHQRRGAAPSFRRAPDDRWPDGAPGLRPQPARGHAPAPRFPRRDGSAPTAAARGPRSSPSRRSSSSPPTLHVVTAPSSTLARARRDPDPNPNDTPRRRHQRDRRNLILRRMTLPTLPRRATLLVSLSLAAPAAAQERLPERARRAHPSTEAIAARRGATGISSADRSGTGGSRDFARCTPSGRARTRRSHRLRPPSPPPPLRWPQLPASPCDCRTGLHLHRSRCVAIGRGSAFTSRAGGSRLTRPARQFRAPTEVADSLYRSATRGAQPPRLPQCSDSFDGHRPYPKSPSAPAAMYFRAFALYQTDNYDRMREARTVLTDLSTRYPNADLADAKALRAQVCGKLAQRGDADCAAEIAEKADPNVDHARPIARAAISRRPARKTTTMSASPR